MCRSCCTSESPGKSAVVVINSAAHFYKEFSIYIYIKEVNSEEAVICKSRRIELIVPNMQPTDHISTGVE
jgi:hypothetical protein